MALQLTDLADQKSRQIEAKTNIVMEIEGVDTIFGSVSIYDYIRIGDPDLVIGDSWVVGGYKLLDGQSPYISFNTGSTTRLSQKLDPARAQGSSVPQMVISLVDKNNEVSELVAPGITVDELLFKNVTVSIGFQDSAFPADYNVVFRGVIQQYECGAGYINFVLSSSEAKKIVPVFPKTIGKLIFPVHYRSNIINTLLYQNREDVGDALTIVYVGGGTAGSESVSVIGGTTIQVVIEELVTTDKQIRKAVENHSGANQLVTVKIMTNRTEGYNFTGFWYLETTQVGSIMSTSIKLRAEDSGLFKPTQDALEAYVQIHDEIIKYDWINDPDLMDIERAQMGTKAAFHDGELYIPDDDRAVVTQFFKVIGNPMDLALKIMLSAGPEFFCEDQDIKSLNFVDPLNRIEGAAIFDKIDVVREYGVAVGDTYIVTLADDPGNNVTGIVTEIGFVNDGSYIVGSTGFTDEVDTPAKIKFKSQFNTLPFGMAMLPREVDVAQHLFIRDTFLNNFQLQVIVEEENNGKDWIEKQLYLPAACFSVPRKGQASVAYHVGPLARDRIQTLDSTTVINATQLKVIRSTSNNFANTIRFAYDYNPGTEKFHALPVYKNDESLERIRVNEKNISIESKGLMTSANGASQAAQSARRLLERYAFGAEYINGVKVQFGTGYTTEIGDVVAVDYRDLQLTDFKTGTRAGEIRLMEVINKTLDNKTGEVSLDLVNTVYNANDRFGLISPSSRTTTGSTTTKLRLRKSWSTKSFQKESNKWKNYIGQEVLVHNPDWSIQYSTTLLGFDGEATQGMNVTALPTAPGDDWVIQAPAYPDSSDKRDLAFWKLRHAYLCHQQSVASGSSTTVFTLSSSSTGLPFVGCMIRVHSDDYSDDSGDVKVTDVSGLVITVGTTLGFTPNNTHLVEIIGMPDGEPAYRIL